MAPMKGFQNRTIFFGVGGFQCTCYRALRAAGGVLLFGPLLRPQEGMSVIRPLSALGHVPLSRGSLITPPPRKHPFMARDNPKQPPPRRLRTRSARGGVQSILILDYPLAKLIPWIPRHINPLAQASRHSGCDTCGSLSRLGNIVQRNNGLLDIFMNIMCVFFLCT